jgi:hypothetical protein
MFLAQAKNAPTWMRILFLHHVMWQIGSCRSLACPGEPKDPSDAATALKTDATMHVAANIKVIITARNMLPTQSGLDCISCFVQ